MCAPQILNSLSTGTYTLTAATSGYVAMLVDWLPAGGGQNQQAWVAAPVATWVDLAQKAGWVPVGAEGMVGADGFLRLTSPVAINSQRGLFSMVPMDPQVCQQKISAAQAAAPASGMRRMLRAPASEPARDAADALKVVREVHGAERQAVEERLRQMRASS